MTSNQDLLPDDDDALADLYAAERRAPGPPRGADDRVKAAVFASVAAGAALGSGAAAATSTATKAAVASTAAASGASTVAAVSGAAAIIKPVAVVVAAVVATAGGGVFVANYDLKDAHDDVGSAHVVVEAPPVAVPPPGLVLETLKEEPKQEEPKKALTTPKKAEPKLETPPPPVETPVETTTLETPEQQKTRLAEERALIGEARGALNRGDVNAALVALESHRDSFAAGALSEEREALTVLALARVGRHDEAQKRAKTFSATWPKSLFQQAIEDALRP